MKRVMILLVFLLLSSYAFAHEEEIEINYEEFLTDLDSIESIANSYLSNLPALARFFIGDLNININFETEGETIDIYVIVQDGLVYAVERGAAEDPNLSIYFDENDVHAVLESENPADDIVNMIDSNEIILESHDIFTSIKISAARRFLR